MKSTLDQIETIKRNGYSLNFAPIFDHAFENFKKISLYSALIILLFSFIFGIAIFGIIATFFGIESISKDLLNGLDVQKLSFVQLIFSTVGVAVVTALGAPFGAGFLKMADCADKDEEFNVSTIFTYYRTPYFMQIFVATLILAMVSTAISNAIESTAHVFVGTILAGAISFLISFFTYMTIPLIIFGKLNAIDAIKSSIILVARNPFMIFILYIVGYLGSLVGAFACGIGILFTLAYNISMTYATYFAIFTIEEEEDSIDSIGRSEDLE